MEISLKIFPQKVLDAGEIKYINEINMKPKFIYDFEEKILNGVQLKKEYENREGNRPRELCEKYFKMRDDYFLSKWVDDWEFGFRPKNNSESIAKYMGVEPYIPSVMINISPNWKGQFGKDKLTDKLMIKHFKKVLDKYLTASNRYSKYKYVLECGSEGNFLHAHIVAEFNKSNLKSVNTHINKGNHALEIRKIWDKTFPEGYVGLLKGKFAIHRIILRVENLRNDKLKYLLENEKPEGHKNLRDLDILVNEGF